MVRHCVGLTSLASCVAPVIHGSNDSHATVHRAVRMHERVSRGLRRPEVGWIEERTLNQPAPATKAGRKGNGRVAATYNACLGQVRIRNARHRRTDG